MIVLLESTKRSKISPIAFSRDFRVFLTIKKNPDDVDTSGNRGVSIFY